LRPNLILSQQAVLFRPKRTEKLPLGIVTEACRLTLGEAGT
jgi:hypothetical protein